MSVGCHSGGWTKRRTTSWEIIAAKELFNNSTHHSSEETEDYTSSYGDDLWGSYPIGSSFSVSCSTEEVFTAPTESTNMAYET